MPKGIYHTDFADAKQYIQMEPNTGCWLWVGMEHGDGYGKFTLHGKDYLAHRVMYELFKGPIPPGLQIDHICKVKSCVAPSHLEAVTVKVNVNRSGRGTQTHCIHGHPFDEKNTRVTATGTRICRACRAAWVRESRGSDGSYIPGSERTHCKRGHEFTEENTLHSGGKRKCRACRRLFDTARRRLKLAT